MDPTEPAVWAEAPTELIRPAADVPPSSLWLRTTVLVDTLDEELDYLRELGDAPASPPWETVSPHG